MASAFHKLAVSRCSPSCPRTLPILRPPSLRQPRRALPSALVASAPRAASTFKPGRAAAHRTSVASPSSSSSPSTLPRASAHPADPDLATAVAQQVRQAAPSLTETYAAYGACEALVQECARQADYRLPAASTSSNKADAGGGAGGGAGTAALPRNARGEDIGASAGSWWHAASGLGLEPTFGTWAQVTLLHLWLLTVRLRAFPREHAPAWHQHLIDHFFFRAEDRMEGPHRMASKGVRQRYLKDLFVRWRGLTAAYDEGLVRGDAVLAAAVWRNVCGADPEVDLVHLAEVVAYMRSVLQQLEAMDDGAIAAGDLVFGDPSGEAAVVRLPSRLMEDEA